MKVLTLSLFWTKLSLTGFKWIAFISAWKNSNWKKVSIRMKFQLDIEVEPPKLRIWKVLTLSLQWKTGREKVFEIIETIEMEAMINRDKWRNAENYSNEMKSVWRILNELNYCKINLKLFIFYEIKLKFSNRFFSARNFQDLIQILKILTSSTN